MAKKKKEKEESGLFFQCTKDFLDPLREKVIKVLSLHDFFIKESEKIFDKEVNPIVLKTVIKFQERK